MSPCPGRGYTHRPDSRLLASAAASRAGPDGGPVLGVAILSTLTSAVENTKENWKPIVLGSRNKRVFLPLFFAR